MITAAHSLTDRFAWLFDGLCKAIGVDARKQRMEAALAWAIWHRVRLLGDRLIALAERVRAGRVPRRRSPRSDTSPRPPGQARGRLSPQGGEGEVREVQKPAACPARPRLPREFGWVGRMLPEAAKYAGALQYLLRDPETLALLEKAPQAGRMLRPLCQLLGVQTPEFLRRGAVVARAVVAAEAARAPDPRLTPAPGSGPGPALSTPAGGEGEGGEDVAKPPEQPAPEPARPSAEEAALAYARRPGGLYWDGTRMRWS
jgi:hypothetical protein